MWTAWGEPIPNSDDQSRVVLPEVTTPICDHEVQCLRKIYSLDRIISSEYHAADLYVELVQRIYTLL